MRDRTAEAGPAHDGMTDRVGGVGVLRTERSYRSDGMTDRTAETWPAPDAGRGTGEA